MKYKVAAADPLYQRMLTLEFDRLGFVNADSAENSGETGMRHVNFQLLCAEGQTELPGSRKLGAAVLIDCGLLAASLPESVKVLILGRPFALSELREFVTDYADSCRGASEDDGIALYPDELSVSFGELEAKLTKREFALFSYLHDRPGMTVTREELLRTLWKDEQARGTNVVDVYVKFLRTKLDEHFGIRLIRSVRGKGYRYDFNSEVCRCRSLGPDDGAEQNVTEGNTNEI